mgnify:CR=1 FL=1|tara:strand:+ start:8178 stop:10106 length:1929 start_codon:yes stop_codon:yes gene_type:complete
MAKKLVYEVEADTSNAEKGLDKVKGKTKDLKKEEKSRSDARKKQIEDEKKEQKDLINSMGLFGITIGGVKAAFKSMATGAKMAFKSIKVGLISTGIGLFVVAIGAVVASFNNSKKGAEKLEVAFSKIGAVVKVLIDRFAQIGGAIRKVFSGDFKGALKDTKDAFKGINAEIKEEVKLMGDLMKAEHALKDAQRELSVQFAQQRAELEQLKMISDDVSKSSEERIDAAKRAFEQEQAMVQERVRQAEEELRIQQERMATSDNQEEDYEREAQLLINLSTIRQESTTKQIELNNKINAITQSIKNEEKALADQRKREHDEEIKRIEERVKGNEAILKAVEDFGKSEQQLKIEQAQKNKDLREKAAKEQLDDLAITQEQFAQTMQDINTMYLDESDMFTVQVDVNREKMLESITQMGFDITSITETWSNAELEFFIETEKKKRDEAEATMNAKIDMTKQGLDTLASFTDSYYKSEQNKLDKKLSNGSISQEKYDKQSEKLQKKAERKQRAFAITQIAIDTAIGVSNAVRGASQSAAGTGPAAIFTQPLFMAQAILSVLGGMAQATALIAGAGGGGSAPEPSVSTDTSTPSVPDISDQQESATPLNPFSYASNDTQQSEILQAYVIENDITDAQALAEELDFQTTL